MTPPRGPNGRPENRGSQRAPATGEENGSFFPGARRILPAELSDAIRIVTDYACGVRSIADHPALDPERKETRIKAVARAIEGTEGFDLEDAAVRSALNLRHLLESRSLDIQDPWQMLQAAGQDIRKSAYPDWSDLLAWCRYWAAPMGRMVFLLSGGAPQGLKAAESMAIAVQLLELVEQAPAQHRWLGRVYLPARWFREAGGDASELAAARAGEALQAVFGRTLDEADSLLAASAGLHRHLPARRLRIAGAIANGEARAWSRALRHADPLKGKARPNKAARLGISLVGVLRGLAS